jgi:hypothetical protein
MSSRPRLVTLGAADFLVGFALFFGTASFVFWQNTRLTVLWDLSYILENATRISLGQLPYRDFPFPYAPLTFLAQALIIKVFGRVVLHHYLYAAFTAGLASLLTWRILLRVVAASRMPLRPTCFLLTAPLVFLGINCIFPHPFYDADCSLFILFCVWGLLRLESANFPRFYTFGCGILLAVPPFIKQNTGLAFFLSAVVCVLWFGIWNRRAAVLLLAGAASGLATALAVIQSTVGLANYFHWTVQFAASRRLPGFTTMLGVYGDPALFWLACVFGLGLALLLVRHTVHRVTLGWTGVALLSLPFLAAVAALLFQDNASDRVEALLRLWPVLLAASLILGLWQCTHTATVARLIPLILLGTIHGALLSQQLWGSTYALWPMLIILIATVLVALTPREKAKDAKGGDGESGDSEPSVLPLIVFAGIVSLALFTTGAYYALSHERLDYVDLSGETFTHSSLPALRGVAMRGDWLPSFEELVAYSNRNIPREDAILMVPGEDLFYFTTGRTPQFPVIMMDNTVNPYSAAELVDFVRQRNVRWVVVKRTLQLQEEPLAFRPQLLELLSNGFSPTASLGNYDIYRKHD